MALRSNMINDCYGAEYVNEISQTNQNELSPYQIFASNNCKYILIRNPSSILSFYSVPHESIIQSWNINNNSIWSIYTSSQPQQITITDSGCLLWSTQYDSVLTEICSDDRSLIFTTTQSAATKTETDIHSNSLPQLFHEQVLWIPLLICIISILCLILWFCINKIFGENVFSNKHKELVDQESSGSSGPISLDSNEEDSEHSDTDQNDNNVGFQSISYEIDSKDEKWKSGDYHTPSTGIITPAQSNMSEDSDLYDDNELPCPSTKLPVVYSNVQQL